MADAARNVVRRQRGMRVERCASRAASLAWRSAGRFRTGMEPDARSRCLLGGRRLGRSKIQAPVVERKGRIVAFSA